LHLPVYPNFVGIELVMSHISQLNIFIVFKIKCTGSCGVHYVNLRSDKPNNLYLISEPIDLNEPVIVIEGISSCTD
jgi:hypothetical protein